MEADASKRVSFLEQEVVPHREQIERGGRTAKRTLTVHNAAGQKVEQSQGVLWPDYVYKRVKGEDPVRVTHIRKPLVARRIHHLSVLGTI